LSVAVTAQCPCRKRTKKDLAGGSSSGSIRKGE
jgi:hypothetical protein